jgi:hypothetical protein
MAKMSKTDREQLSKEARQVLNLYGEMSDHYKLAMFYQRAMVVRPATTFKQACNVYGALVGETVDTVG